LISLYSGFGFSKIISYNIGETGIFSSIPNSTLSPCATITGELCV